MKTMKRGPKPKPLSDRFWSKVRRGEPLECWEWTAWKNSAGYGQIQEGPRGGAIFRANRVAYELTKGPIPEGLQILHSCDNPGCCNPDHLRIGTHRDNMRDKLERGRSAKGETNGRVKLTTEQVRQIRDRYQAGTVTQRELGVEFGISNQQISRIINRVLWSEEVLCHT